MVVEGVVAMMKAAGQWTTTAAPEKAALSELFGGIIGSSPIQTPVLPHQTETKQLFKGLKSCTLK
jgi:hypothetical protein